MDDDAKRNELASLFGLTEEERTEVRAAAGGPAGAKQLLDEEEEELWL